MSDNKQPQNQLPPGQGLKYLTDIVAVHLNTLPPCHREPVRQACNAAFSSVGAELEYAAGKRKEDAKGKAKKPGGTKK